LFSYLSILLPLEEPAQNLSEVTNDLNPYVHILQQDLMSMYGKPVSNKTGLTVWFSIIPQPTTCKSRKMFEILL